MKVGILTLHSQINYGGVLQAYALQRYLLNRGYEVEVIDYWLRPDNVSLRGFWLNSSYSLIHRVCRFFYIWLRDGFTVAEIVRRLRTIRFIRDSIRCGVPSCRGIADLEHYATHDVIIVGSDQVWNPSPRLGTPNPFLLGWLKRSESNERDFERPVRRVAYAASFGVTEIPITRQDEYRQALNQFYAISVREIEGSRIVASLIRKEVPVVLDPTLLLSREEWKSLIQNTRVGSKYACCYWLGDFNLLQPLLKEMTHNGLRVRLLLEWGVGIAKTYADRMRIRVFLMGNPHIRVCFASGPKEFVKLMSSADAILSDSFHAMMFGTIFEKPMCIVHKSSRDRVNMGARLWDFAKEYQLDGVVREYLPERFTESIFVQPDYEKARTKLSERRETSLQFLVDALHPQ